MRSLIGFFCGLSLVVVIAMAQQSGISQFTKLERARYDKKLADFRRNKVNECNRKAMLIANAMVDSALVAQDILIDIDTMLAPHRPDKPSRPSVPSQGVDSVQVTPIFKEVFTD